MISWLQKLSLIALAIAVSACTSASIKRESEQIQEDLQALEVIEMQTDVLYSEAQKDPDRQASIDIRKFEKPCVIEFDSNVRQSYQLVSGQLADLSTIYLGAQALRRNLLYSVSQFEICALRFGFDATQTVLTPRGKLTYDQYTREFIDITSRMMSVREKIDRQEENRVTLSSVACALARGAGGTVSVRGYYRKDGTYVRPHTRSAPNRAGGC